MFKTIKRLALILMGSVPLFISVTNVHASYPVDQIFNNNTTDASTIWSTMLLAIVMSALLGLFVLALLVYIGWKYREGSSTPRKPLSHRSEQRLEYSWMVLSLLLVVIAGAVTVAAMGSIAAYDNSQNVYQTYYVQGQQFQWSFYYVNNTHLPQKISNINVLNPYLNQITNNTNSNGLQNLNLTVDKTYEFIISSHDVIHSFFVYDLNIKQDAVPGSFAIIYVTPTQVGSYNIQCAQFCGKGHWTMADVQFVNVNA